MMTMTWGATTLPSPESWDDGEEFIGSQYVTADGSLVSDVVASKRRLRLRWSGITTAERDDIASLALDDTAQSMSLPGGDSYTVKPIRGSYRATPDGPTPHWSVEVEVREE